ncbi:inverted formin-2-like [Mizuhopecten yessoensis]|uniref:Inverted formin-2 n=1 Tax=Mizuhopecten yessoensis TaxID=6573 RepID=A0A210R0F0_MIZYE|nr:inverted formin-2-like [Mizuhopecten yessoensis]OWF54490.1 Inverted formin-2 [Mizuhopecten yessoensis]
MARRRSDNVERSMTELEIQMRRGTPEKCILLSHSAPSVQMFYALRMRLESSSEVWLQEFLDLDGLQSLLASLCQMTGRGFTSFSDAIFQLDCISCIRNILNTHVGLDFMVRNDGYTSKLALALSISNTLPKKQILEMMSAVCAYSNLGYQAVLTALNTFKKEMDQTHRFSIIINELKSAETVSYKTAILTFINSVINCTADVVERNRLRNEFNGLNLLDILSFLRKEEGDDALHLQLQVFHEKKHADEEVLYQDHFVDFNSPEDLVDLIQSKIFGTPKMVSFVNILQDLLAIDSVYNKNSTKLWKNIDNLVHQAIHTCGYDEVMSSSKNDKLTLDLLPDDCDLGLQYITNYQLQSDFVPKMMVGSMTKSTDIKGMSQLNSSSPLSMNRDHKCENDTGVELTNSSDERSKVAYRTSMLESMDRSHYDNVFITEKELSIVADTPTNKSALQRRYQIKKVPTPQPRKTLKHLSWLKLEDSTVDLHKDSVWMVSGGNQRVSPDFDDLERLFQVQERHNEDMNEVIILSPQTRRNLNLFLGRMEISAEELIQSLELGNSVVVNVPTLRYLLQVLPQPQEITTLQCFGGQRHELGMPEQFVLLLADIPDYEILIQGHLTKAEYTSSLQKLKSSLNVMIMMCKKIMQNNELKEFLHFVLLIGNFLNHGCLHGDAMGFKMSSLERLLDVKSALPNRSLLHHIIKMAEEKDKVMLKFIDDLLPLEKAVSSSLYDMKGEISKFNKQLCSFVQLLASGDHRMKTRFHSFIEEVKVELRDIQTSTNTLRESTQQLADYLCEDLGQFELETTLKCLHTFCKQVRKCQKENESFQKQTQLARKKTDMKCLTKNRLLSLEFGKDAGASSSMMEDRNKILEKILDDLHRGNFRPTVTLEVHTPDTDIDPLEFSDISFVGSPFPMRPTCEAMEEDFLTPPSKTVGPRTSSEADILAEESQQDITLEFSKDYIENYDEEPKNWVVAKSLVDSLEPISDRHLDMVKKQTKHQGHNRSRSDLATSILTTEKWMKYEEIRHQESLHEDIEAPLAEPESMCAISTLNLENHGRFVDRDDVKLFEEQQKEMKEDNVCSVEEGPILKLPLSELLPDMKSLMDTKEMSCKRPEKRSSVSNFFNKISRAVLKPKNVYSTPGSAVSSNTKSQKDGFRMFGRRKTTSSLTSDNKENIIVAERMSQRLSSVDKKFAVQELRKIKHNKLRASKGK